ncbi:hypothetical protein [Oceanobacillus saliphilus]|nr:hypothetical protein [Oceanobacillus saliphilus]
MKGKTVILIMIISTLVVLLFTWLWLQDFIVDENALLEIMNFL